MFQLIANADTKFACKIIVTFSTLLHERILQILSLLTNTIVRLSSCLVVFLIGYLPVRWPSFLLVRLCLFLSSYPHYRVGKRGRTISGNLKPTLSSNFLTILGNFKLFFSFFVLCRQGGLGRLHQ